MNNPEGLIREVYTDIEHVSSGDIRSLYHNNKYPDKPDKVSILQDFDSPEDVGDYYGQRVRGYFFAPQDGEYKFFTSCDAMCELYFSVDDKPSHVSKIVAQVQPSKHDQFEK